MKRTSFLVKIDHTVNHTMQGTIHWLEENKVTRFRSVFEMNELMVKAHNEFHEVTWDHEEKVLVIDKHLKK